MILDGAAEWAAAPARRSLTLVGALESAQAHEKQLSINVTASDRRLETKRLPLKRASRAILASP
jgi:hypothetical protein